MFGASGIGNVKPETGMVLPVWLFVVFPDGSKTQTFAKTEIIDDVQAFIGLVLFQQVEDHLFFDGVAGEIDAGG